ncbi:MAG: PD-(D/E)XK nuclease family protein, partial [bacterium]
NYTNSTLLFDFDYFNDYYLKNFDKIIFVNIIGFSPREKDLISLMEEYNYEVELYIQLQENDYDKYNKKINSFSLPANLSTEIKLYHTEDKLLQIINLISNTKKEKAIADICILDADFDKSNYERILCSDKISVDKDSSFTETSIYKYLETLYSLLMSADFTKVDIKVEIKTLLEACYQKQFRRYYNLSKTDLNILQKLAADDYVYLSTGLLEMMADKLTGFRALFDTLKRINSIKDLYEFIGFLQTVDLRSLKDDKYSNDISQYFDSLLEIHSIEEMGIVSSWNKYFSNKSQGLFRLILNYLRFKRVVRIKNDNTDSFKIKDLFSSAQIKHDNLFIINASRGVIPSEGLDGFLLTDKQRYEMGLKTSEDIRIEEKYYFFRHIMNSKKAIVFSLENLEENITSSSFVDELMIEYNIDVNKLDIQAEDYPLIVNNIFNNNRNSYSDYLSNNTIQDDKLIPINEDFGDGFSLTYYKYDTLKKCYYKFYLEHIAKLEEEKVDIMKELGPRVLGIMVHDIFAEIIDRVGINSMVDEKMVEKIAIKKFKSYHLLINDYYNKYYTDILLPRIQHSVIYFIKSIRRRIDGEIREVLTEVKPDTGKYIYKNQMSKTFLNGRIDLLIRTDLQSYLIDFKTGSGNIKQLDFYSLLIKSFPQEDIGIDKFIYAVLDEKFEIGRNGTESDFAEEIIDTLTEFFADHEYSYKYKSICERCNMTDICRVVK